MSNQTRSPAPSDDRIVNLPLQDAHKRVRTVFVRDYETEAAIGVYASEQGRTQRIRLNIDLKVQDPVTPISDDLSHVVCYDTLIQNIERLLRNGHIGLVETLADQIIDLALEDVRVLHARVRVEKLDAISNASSVGVEIEKHQMETNG